MSKWLQSKTTIKPLVGIVCGSGLGNIAELVQDQLILPYNDIPDFPRSTGKPIITRKIYNSQNKSLIDTDRQHFLQLKVIKVIYYLVQSTKCQLYACKVDFTHMKGIFYKLI